MNQQFISIDSVFSKLIRSGRTSFSETDVIEWCGEALEFIGAVRAYEEAVAFIEVKNHQCNLPLGLHKIIQVARNRNINSYKSCTPLNICKQTQGNPCVTPSSDGVWLDCNGTPIVSYDIAYYRPYFDLRTEFYGFSNTSYYKQNFVPMRLANHTLFNTLVSEEGCSGYSNYGSDEYTVILGNTLRTSFKDGQVCVSFYRQVRDPKTGYPMIPDEESYKTAINKYLLMQMAGVDFENGRDGAKMRLDKYESDWHWYCGQAADKAMMLSGIDEYQNFLDQRVKLIPNYNSYYRFFGNLSKPEVGYPAGSLGNYSENGQVSTRQHAAGCPKDSTCCCSTTNDTTTIVYKNPLPLVTVYGNELEPFDVIEGAETVTHYRWTNAQYDGYNMEVFLNSINRFLNTNEYAVKPGGIVEILVGGPYTAEDMFKMIPASTIQ